MLLYRFSIAILGIFIQFLSFFNSKARKWCLGRRNILENLQNAEFEKSNSTIWFHCASLGEFEQARPLIEKIKTMHPESKILLTFFSPSGFEIRKNYDKANWVFYLPLDTIKNAKNFIKITKPKMAFFIKYEFWYNYLNQLKINNIPTFSVSAIFRENQFYFKWYSFLLHQPLPLFTHIFVQNLASKNLLDKLNIDSTISGDTRFDRVFELSKNKKKISEIEKFKGKDTMLVIGSAWIEDIKILFDSGNTFYKNIKIIIAPHEIDSQTLNSISQIIKSPLGFYSKNEFDKNILVIDNIGMLNNIYQYADVSYIGGAFGKGLHNILESATYGVPIVFGLKYQKFQEAKDLIVLAGAFSISKPEEANQILNTLIQNKELRKNSGLICQNYVTTNTGAVDIIYSNIGSHFKNIF